jgi:iron complex outermembrane receptor protein
MQLRAGLAPYSLCTLTVTLLVGSYPKCTFGQEAETASLQEVVVTAQKRGENLQKVPVAVAAFSADTLEKQGIGSALDLPAAIPGMVFSSSVGGSRITIRGVGGAGVLGDEAANSVYIDGVYMPSTPTLVTSFNNIDRIEVLKGPQGTLFGRNASGGVIQIITRAPSVDPQGKLSVGYGNFGRSEESFYGTAGKDTVAVDLAVNASQQSKGWGRNLTIGRDAYDGDSLAGRASVLWTPSEATSIRFAALGGNSDTITKDGGQIVPGEITTNRNPALNVANQGFYNTTQDNTPDYNVKQQNYSLHASQDLGWARLVNIASRDRVDQHIRLDLNYGPAGPGATLPRTARTWTEELQLNSPDSSPIKWIVGGFYYSNADRLDISILNAGSLIQQVHSEMNTRSWAAFGQATFPILAATNLTLGARYTRDTHDFQGNVLTPAATTVVTPESAVDTKPTYRVALDQQLSDAVLGYVSFTTGFKSGFYNLTTPTDPRVKPQSVKSPEIGLKSELFDRRVRLNAAAFYTDFSDIQVRVVQGLTTSFFNAAKARIAGLDLDAEAAATERLTVRAAMSYLYSEYTSFDNAPLFHVDSLGRLISDGRGSVQGNQLVNAPKWVGTLGADYRMPFVSGSSLVLSGTYNYNGGYYFDAQNRPQTRNDAYRLLNASLAFISRNDVWQVRVYGNNLTDAKYYSDLDVTAGTGDIYWPAAPRTFGGQVTFNF